MNNILCLKGKYVNLPKALNKDFKKWNEKEKEIYLKIKNC